MSGVDRRIYVAMGLAAVGGLAAAFWLQARPASALLPTDPLQAALICRDDAVIGEASVSRSVEIYALYFREQAARA